MIYANHFYEHFINPQANTPDISRHERVLLSPFHLVSGSGVVVIGTGGSGPLAAGRRRRAYPQLPHQKVCQRRQLHGVQALVRSWIGCVGALLTIMTLLRASQRFNGQTIRLTAFTVCFKRILFFLNPIHAIPPSPTYRCKRHKQYRLIRPGLWDTL